MTSAASPGAQTASPFRVPRTSRSVVPAALVEAGPALLVEAIPAALLAHRACRRAPRACPWATKPMARRRPCDLLSASEPCATKVLTTALTENPIFVACGVERYSAMDRGDLGNLTAFVAVADQRSFRAAASQLGVTPSALSHSMRQLEERLGVRLLHRTTRSVSATDAGLRLLDRLRPAMSQISDALEDLNQERQRPLGRLRIYAVHLAGAAVLAPIWGRFLSTYPEVHLEIALSEAPIDIVAKGFDAGIGPRDRVPTDMIAVRVAGPMKVAVVGAPAYFARRRPPRTPDDLSRHSCVQYRRATDGNVFVWPFERDRKWRRISVDGR